MSDVLPGGEIRGVLLPLRSGQLLLPNSSVAEVIGYREPDVEGEAGESWLVGWLTWRQLRLPLVDFDRLLGVSDETPGTRARIAICHTLGGDPEFPYIGLRLQSIPHLVRVSEETITLPEGEELPPMSLCRLQLNGQPALIPDLDALEQALNRS